MASQSSVHVYTVRADHLGFSGKRMETNKKELEPTIRTLDKTSFLPARHLVLGLHSEGDTYCCILC